MKVIVVKSFRDVNTRKIYNVDDELEVSAERAQTLIELGLAKAERVKRRKNIDE